MPNPTEFLSFLVSGQGYAIDIALTREIRGWTEPSAMPDTLKHELGVINLRGEMLPLIDLSAMLGLPAPEINERSVIIVAEVGSVFVGLLVDSVSDIIAPSQEDMRQPPEMAGGEKHTYVCSLTVIDEKMIRILDLEAALAPKKESAA